MLVGAKATSTLLLDSLPTGRNLYLLGTGRVLWLLWRQAKSHIRRIRHRARRETRDEGASGIRFRRLLLGNRYSARDVEFEKGFDVP